MENIEIINNVDCVLKFMSKNFKTTNKTEKIKSFRDLVNYMSLEGIELSFEEATKVLKESPKLSDILESVKEENISDISNESIENLFLADELSKNKDNEHLGDVPLLSKSIDLDTFRLYLTTMPKMLSDEETELLIEKMANGDEEAKRTLVEHNLRLAVSIAKRYSSSGVPLPDLVQEGNMGLMIAANKFNKNLNCRFSTYAVWWIRQKITRYIADNSRTIRIPVYMHELVLKVNRAKKNLSTELNRDPSREEIAKYLDIDVSKVYAAEKFGFDCVSLETKIKSGDDSESSDLSTFVADENAYFEGKVIDKVYNSEFDKAIFEGSVLDDKSKTVLKYRYGFVDGRVRTLEEIGKMFGVTRERIRQIEAKSLRMLKKSGTLRDFRPEKMQENNGNVYDNEIDYNLVLKK